MILLQEEELKTQDPSFWENPKEAEEQMRKIRSVRTWTDGYREVEKALEDFRVLYDFFEAKEAAEEEVDQAYQDTLEVIGNLEARNMLRNEEDRLGAVLRINAGAGGTESNDWANMLLRM